MDTKTYFSMHMPDFVQQWKHYKKGLRGINLKEWCIASDYVDDSNKPNGVATFTIFPRSIITKLIYEISTNIPTDIKNRTHVSSETLDYLRNSPYFFNICVIIKNKKLLCNEKLSRSLHTLIEFYKNTDENKERFKDKYLKVQKLNQYLKQGNCSKEKVGLMLFVAKFMSYICEFLLIKENCSSLNWFSDRDPIAEMMDKIIYDFVIFYTEQKVHQRITDYNLSAPILNTQKAQEEYDTLIRIPDIISGVFSSLHPRGKDLAYEKEKHKEIFVHSILSNDRIITLDFDIQQDNIQYVKSIKYLKRENI